MANKLKSTKRRTKMKDVSTKAKVLSSKDKKKVKGGILPYIEQDYCLKPTSTITPPTSSITDGTSNTFKPK